MKRWERWSFNLFALAVAASGFAYFWMKYLLQAEDPFAVVNHPWQNAMLHLHVLASPPFVLVFGVILNSHIMKKLRATRLPNRKTGLASFTTFAAMIASGYLLQVATTDAWLRGLVIVHVASGVVFALTYGVHLAISVRLVRRPAAAAMQELA
jgi:hypothetical protein